MSVIDAGVSIRSEMVEWLKRDALPLWAGRGWDLRRGGFVERLDAFGEPDLDAPRRVRVQARQTYVYAHAATLGWHPEARAVALRGFEWLHDRCRPAAGRPGFIHVVAGDGSPIDARIDAYDQATCLLALAWMFRLTGDAQIRAMIDAELAFIDEQLVDSEVGGWHEGIPQTLPRRQNPQMHGFEAMLALYEATGERAFLARARAILSLVIERFIDPHSGVLYEFFDEGLQPIVTDTHGVADPGHHFEWTWLMLTYARLAGVAPQPQAQRLYDWAMRFGIAPNGLPMDEVRPDGRPKLRSHRLWPLTELAKANLALARAGRDATAADRADDALITLRKRYLSETVQGGWIDRLNDDGTICDARMPASSFYHVFCAVAEAARRE